MLPDIGAIYSDRDSRRMLQKRRHYARGALANTLIVSILLFLAFAQYYVNAWGQSSTEERASIVVITALSLVLMLPVIYRYQFVRDRNMFRYGITLTPLRLRLFTEEIPVGAIVRAETIWLGTSGTFLAVDYTIDRGGKKKVVTRLLSENSTENIYHLRDGLRDLKRWPKQEDTPKYSLSKWRRERTLLFRDGIRTRDE